MALEADEVGRIRPGKLIGIALAAVAFLAMIAFVSGGGQQTRLASASGGSDISCARASELLSWANQSAYFQSRHIRALEVTTNVPDGTSCFAKIVTSAGEVRAIYGLEQINGRSYISGMIQ